VELLGGDADSAYEEGDAWEEEKMEDEDAYEGCLEETETVAC
jgi:hypothetical protein